MCDIVVIFAGLWYEIVSVLCEKMPCRVLWIEIGSPLFVVTDVIFIELDFYVA